MSRAFSFFSVRGVFPYNFGAANRPKKQNSGVRDRGVYFGELLPINCYRLWHFLLPKELESGRSENTKGGSQKEEEGKPHEETCLSPPNFKIPSCTKKIHAAT